MRGFQKIDLKKYFSIFAYFWKILGFWNFFFVKKQYSHPGHCRPRGKVVRGRVFGFRDKYLKKLQFDWNETAIFGKFTLKSF